MDGIALMEHGFLHPERGYWQTSGTPSDALLQTYPAGTVEVPLRPSTDHQWIDGEWSYVAPAAPSEAELLTAERAGMVVSRFQARAALLQAGLLAQAEAAVASADAMTQIAWADAVEFRRNSPTIATLAGVLQLSPEDLDTLFRTAATIEA